ncbi:MAG: phosphonate ABC transporter ATP-binding protein [bacterium]|nr:phosphonate ABC transporter ATP-binding protein [bacterium]
MIVSNLTKKFGKVIAVNCVSFRVDQPQMVGIIGASGAGKSTLLRMINRLTEASEGSIVVDGREILSLKGKEKRRWQKDCAMIFQQFNLVPRLDVVTNVLLGRLNGHGSLKSIFSIFGRQLVSEAMSALTRLGIADQALQRADTLSGGQQQRVAIARALMQQPKTVLADEPIASLDPMSAEVVMNALREIRDRDQLNVICNLHTLDTARTYCDRVIGMSNGRVVFDDLPAKLTAEAVRKIYGASAELNEGVTSTSIYGLSTDHHPGTAKPAFSQLKPA